MPAQQRSHFNLAALCRAPARINSSELLEGSRKMPKCQANHGPGPFGAFPCGETAYRPTIALSGFKQASSLPPAWPSASNLPLTQPGEPLDANTSPSGLVPAYSQPGPVGPHLTIASTDSQFPCPSLHMCPPTSMTCPGPLPQAPPDLAAWSWHKQEGQLGLNGTQTLPSISSLT